MRALVTGAARRVGAAIARELAAHGFDVVIHYHRSADEAEQVAASCRAHGVSVELLQADLGSDAGLVRLVAGMQALEGGLDLLVNNASIFEPEPFEEITLASWDRMMRINARAPFFLSQALLPQLRQGNGDRPGTVVHLCDIGGERPVPGYAHYSMSKAALIMLVRAMAVELAPAVRTLGVSPGQVVWPEDYSADKRQRILKRVPMDRVGTPEEVAQLVRFLALEAPFLNGAVVPIDGGHAALY